MTLPWSGASRSVSQADSGVTWNSIFSAYRALGRHTAERGHAYHQDVGSSTPGCHKSDGRGSRILLRPSVPVLLGDLPLGAQRRPAAAPGGHLATAVSTAPERADRLRQPAGGLSRSPS